jgi:hypothetical protein
MILSPSIPGTYPRSLTLFRDQRVGMSVHAVSVRKRNPAQIGPSSCEGAARPLPAARKGGGIFTPRRFT